MKRMVVLLLVLMFFAVFAGGDIVWNRPYISGSDVEGYLTSEGWSKSTSLSAPVTVTTAGTVYTVTASDAGINFGTTDPNFVPNVAGTWAIEVTVQYDWVSATQDTEEVLTTKLMRRNNTPATLATRTFTCPAVTATSATQGQVKIIYVYKTANTNDQLGLNCSLAALPDSGSLTVTSVVIVAQWINSTTSDVP